MKIDRLIGILAVLLSKDKVTAPYLAEKFEVSKRTIHRDIEAICKAGIPLVTTQGKNGGISIMDGYRVDRTVLTSSDMQAILAGLRSLDSVSKTNKMQQLMDKLCLGNTELMTLASPMMINLSSWYKDSLAPKIEQIQSAILRRERIGFEYYGPSGYSRRIVEPGLLIFEWGTWYIWGYCCERLAFRLFKLNRIQALKSLGEIFEYRLVPLPKLSPERIFPPRIEIKVLFEPEMKWRLVEMYGLGSFTEREDHRLLLSRSFTSKEEIFCWLLSFGRNARVVEPEYISAEFIKHIEGIINIYKS